MKKEWLSLLQDPFDGSDIALKEILIEEDNRIFEGTLISGTGNIYQVRQGIPCFLSKTTQDVETVTSFEYEWNEFGFLYAKKGWIQDIVEPLVSTTDYFKDKVIIDCGAGSGAQSRWMAESGAKLVISLELSNTIYTRHKKTISDVNDKVFAIQCDIANPPLKIKADIVYCINVIQHTADVEGTFKSLVRLLDDTSVFMFNVYTEKPSAPLVRTARKLTTLLPFKLVYYMSFIMAIFLYGVIKLMYITKQANSLIPQIRSFKETWLDIYDLLGPHKYQAYMTRTAQLKMIKDNGLVAHKNADFGYLLKKHKL